MAIANNYKNKYIFHFTDIRNLDSIIKNGLLCTNIKNKNGITHRNIANTNIQNRRATMKVPVEPKGKVHDFVPFYFSSINPMLLKKLNEKNVKPTAHSLSLCENRPLGQRRRRIYRRLCQYSRASDIL